MLPGAVPSTEKRTRETGPKAKTEAMSRGN